MEGGGLKGKMANRKLVMDEHEGSVLVGIVQDGCDSVVKTLEGTLEDVLAAVPQFLTEARRSGSSREIQPRPLPSPNMSVVLPKGRVAGRLL